MNMHLGLRTLGLLVLVAAATAIVVQPGLLGNEGAAGALPMLVHH